MGRAQIIFGAEAEPIGVSTGIDMRQHWHWREGVGMILSFCKESCEPVVGFLPNLHRYIIKT